jgi:uncharacterized protein YndB with AHSA1/START domain
MPICEIDLRIGGTYRFVEGNGMDGTEMRLSGEYIEIVPPSRIVATESFAESWYPGSAVVATDFSPADCEQGREVADTGRPQ